MDEDEFKLLESLCSVYNRAKSVCDPIEFVKRQQELLYQLAECLLASYVKEKHRRDLIDDHSTDDFTKG